MVSRTRLPKRQRAKDPSPASVGGTKRTNEAGLLMSAFEGKAEVGLRDRQDRF